MHWYHEGGEKKKKKKKKIAPKAIGPKMKVIEQLEFEC